MPTQQQLYARRRGVALLALLIIGVWIWVATANPFGSSQPEMTTSASTESASVSASAAPEGEVAACQPGVVQVEVMIGDETGPRERFASDETPLMWYSITNTGLVDCEFNVGLRGTFFTITSGDQTYWSSKQCEREGLTDAFRTLPSNQSVLTEKGPWDKVYSSENGCNSEGNDPVPTGGATYRISVDVNGALSEAKRFILD